MKELSKGCNSYLYFFFFHPPSHSVWSLLKLFGWLLHPETMPQHSRSGITMLHGQCLISWHVRSIWQRTSKAGLKKQVFMPDSITCAWLWERAEIRSAQKKTSVDRHMGCMKFNETVPLTRMWSTDFSLDTGMFHAVSKI